MADKGKIWVGGWSGLYSFDPVSVSITMIKRGAVDGIGSNSNFPMMIDTINQKAWIGVEPWGIDEMEIPALTYRPLIFKDMERRKIIPENINSWLVKPFQNGFLFVIQGRGIFFVNRDSLVAQQVLDFPQAIFNLVVADDKYLFLCRFRPFDNLTYIFKNGKWLKTANPLDSLGWVNIFHNKIDQTYWIGTDKELFQFNSSFQKNRSYTEKDGLP
ncbi:MAG: hypothetical protein ACXWCZ_08575, partial [Flavisolibacter sp.]